MTVVRGDQLDQNAVSAEEAYVGDVSALSRLNERYRAPDHHRGDRRGRQGVRAAHRRRPALRHPDRRARARSPRCRCRMPASSPTRRRRCTPSSTSNGAASPSCAAIRRTRSTSSCRSARSATGCRCASGWAPCRRSRASSCATSESDRAELRLEYFGTTEELQRTLALAGLRARQGSRQVAIAGAVIAHRGG